MNNRRYGDEGERAAEAYFTGRGAVVLARNYRCRAGEIDLIVEAEDTVVFVEVKRRSSLAFGTPAEAVGRVKQARISQTSLTYLQEKGWLERRVRYDVVEVSGARVRHIPAAFYPIFP